MNNLNDIFFAPAANQDLTYDQVLEDVQRYFAENHASTIAEAGEANAERATALLKELMVQYIVKRKYAISGLTTEQLCEQLYCIGSYPCLPLRTASVTPFRQEKRERDSHRLAGIPAEFVPSPPEKPRQICWSCHSPPLRRSL